MNTVSKLDAMLARMETATLPKEPAAADLGLIRVMRGMAKDRVPAGLNRRLTAMRTGRT